MKNALRRDGFKVMSECVDPRIGTMLHAYELNALEDEETELFEAHSLKCDYCFRKISSFDREAMLLSHDSDIHRIVNSACLSESEGGRSRLTGRVGKYIWPDTPLIFRPALAYLLILLMIYPVYLGLKGTPDRDIHAVRNTVYLSTLRSASRRQVLSIDKDAGAVMIYYDDADTARAYTLVIESEGGREILHKEKFVQFDRFGNSLVLIPRIMSLK